MFLAFFVKKLFFCWIDLEMDILALKMTSSHENITRNVFPSKNHMKMRYILHMFLPVFVKNGIFAHMTFWP